MFAKRLLAVLLAAASLTLAGCSDASYEGPTAADVQPEGNLAYKDFREVSRTFTDEKPKKGSTTAQPATQQVAWTSPEAFKVIDVMSWYAQQVGDKGWGSCPDASAPDLSSNRIDYCKTVDDRPHRLTLLSGNKGDTLSQDFKTSYTIGLKLPKATTTR